MAEPHQGCCFCAAIRIEVTGARPVNKGRFRDPRFSTTCAISCAHAERGGARFTPASTKAIW